MMSERANRAVVAAAAVVGIVATFRLGVWQIHRGAEKEALQTSMRTRGEMPPLAMADLARDSASVNFQAYRPIHLSGRWMPEHTIYLDNRQMDAHPGFFVMTPLLLAPGDAVVVQRGWVPRNLLDRTRLPPIATPTGPVEITGRVAPPPSKLLELGTPATGAIRQNLDIDAFAREIGTGLRPLSIQQLDAAGTPADGLRRDWPLPALDVSRNRGYALQWFALCALIAGLYVWFQLIRPRRAPSERPVQPAA